MLFVIDNLRNCLITYPHVFEILTVAPEEGEPVQMNVAFDCESLDLEAEKKIRAELLEPETPKQHT